MVTVLYDANVLYPAPLRDFLIQLAISDLFQARWTKKIHEEWTRNLLKNRSDLTQEKLTRTQELMNCAVPDCLIENYENLIPSLQLPDPDDRHILAAAIVGRVDIIVTFNLSDFPSSILKNYQLEAQHPDHFISDLIALAPAKILEAANYCRNRLNNPSRSVDQYLATLRKQGLEISVTELQKLYT